MYNDEPLFWVVTGLIGSAIFIWAAAATKRNLLELLGKARRKSSEQGNRGIVVTGDDAVLVGTFSVDQEGRVHTGERSLEVEVESYEWAEHQKIAGLDPDDRVLRALLVYRPKKLPMQVMKIELLIEGEVIPAFANTYSLTGDEAHWSRFRMRPHLQSKEHEARVRVLGGGNHTFLRIFQSHHSIEAKR